MSKCGARCTVHAGAFHGRVIDVACSMLCHGMKRLGGCEQSCGLEPALPAALARPHSRNQCAHSQSKPLRHAVFPRRAASAHSAAHSPDGQVRHDSPMVMPSCPALHQRSQFIVQKSTNAVLSVLAKSNDALPYAVVLAALLALLLPQSFAWFTPRWAHHLVSSPHIKWLTDHRRKIVFVLQHVRPSAGLSHVFNWRKPAARGVLPCLQAPQG